MFQNVLKYAYSYVAGRAPMCNVDANTCKLYGFDYDVSHPRGPIGDDWCLDNSKVIKSMKSH